MHRPASRFTTLGTLALAAGLVTSANAQVFNRTPEVLSPYSPQQAERAVQIATQLAARLIPGLTYGPEDRFDVFAGYHEGKQNVIIVAPRNVATRWRVAIDPKTWKVKEEFYTGLCHTNGKGVLCKLPSGETFAP